MTPPEVNALLAGCARLQASAEVVLRGLENRAGLAALELGETRKHAAVAVVVLALGAVSALLAGFALTLLVAAVFWDTPHRLDALAWLAGAELALAALAAWRVRVGWRSWAPFAATLEQLRKDSQCLHELWSTHGR